jgi:hypothetical protein
LFGLLFLLLMMIVHWLGSLFCSLERFAIASSA